MVLNTMASRSRDDRGKGVHFKKEARVEGLIVTLCLSKDKTTINYKTGIYFAINFSREEVRTFEKIFTILGGSYEQGQDNRNSSNNSGFPLGYHAGRPGWYYWLQA
jgi:hypothetical protein